MLYFNSNLGATLSPPFASLPPAPASTAASPSPPPAVGTGNRRRGESRAPRRRTVPACRLHRDVTKSWPAMARKNRRPLSQPVIRKSHALVDKVWREDFLLEAWGIVRLPTQSSSSCSSGSVPCNSINASSETSITISSQPFFLVPFRAVLPPKNSRRRCVMAARLSRHAAAYRISSHVRGH